MWTFWGLGGHLLPSATESGAHSRVAHAENGRRDESGPSSFPFPPPCRHPPSVLWKQRVATHHFPFFKGLPRCRIPLAGPGKPVCNYLAFWRWNSLLSSMQWFSGICLYKNHLGNPCSNSESGSPGLLLETEFTWPSMIWKQRDSGSSVGHPQSSRLEHWMCKCLGSPALAAGPRSRDYVTSYSSFWCSQDTQCFTVATPAFWTPPSPWGKH